MENFKNASKTEGHWKCFPETAEKLKFICFQDIFPILEGLGSVIVKWMTQFQYSFLGGFGLQFALRIAVCDAEDFKPDRRIPAGLQEELRLLGVKPTTEGRKDTLLRDDVDPTVVL